MPYERIGWPILSAVRRRITHGPNTRPMTSEVIAAMTARKVMYWKTRMKPNSGEYACSHWARLSSMAPPISGEARPHAHEARALDEHRRGARPIVERGDQRLDAVERARACERRRRARALGARGPERLDAALGRVSADLA